MYYDVFVRCWSKALKCYKFWVREIKRIRVGDGQQPITLIAGSNVSKTDASLNAERMALSVEARIQNPRQIREPYEVTIKEHVVKEIDPNNVVTVNRYGARVLNTTEYTILDIDCCPFAFMDLFRSSKGDAKDRSVDRFKRRVMHYPELGTSFRVYETCKGIRVIGKKYFDPQAKQFPRVMRSLAVDSLYCTLSRKQNCYRARLTPKAYRMKTETIQIKTPLDCEGDAYAAWQRKYDETSNGYSVVALREVVGKDFWDDPVILFHDQLTRMRSGCPLA